MSDKKPLIGEGVFFVPRIASDKEKRGNIRNVRKSRRKALKEANTREEKKSIREEAREKIRTERGGVSQVREIFTDVKDFADEINQLKSNIQGTTVGRVANLAKNLIGHVSSGNYAGLAKDVQSGVSIVQGRKKQTKNKCS